MKRCEEKIRYRTAAGARWALWGIWLDRYLRGRATAASGVRTRVRIATGGISRRRPGAGDERRVDTDEAGAISGSRVGGAGCHHANERRLRSPSADIRSRGRMEIDTTSQVSLFLAEGRCEGAVSGRFRGANFPRRQGATGPFRPDFRAVIETDEGSTIMVELHGYGRSHPLGCRQVVGAIFHSSDADGYRRLNDAVCVCVGEVRAPADLAQAEPDLVLDAPSWSGNR